MISNGENQNNSKQQFTYPTPMQQYSTLQSFLAVQPTVESREEQMMRQLFGMNMQVSNLNMSMFVSSTPSNSYYLSSFVCPETWEGIFNSETGIYELNKAFEKLRKIAQLGNTIYPLENEIFRAFQLCKRNNLKVVMFGQDPYPGFDDIVGLPMANGLSFSGRKGGKKPASLANVFKEIERTFPGIPLNHYDLTSWAEQGVLLLNTCLTVNHGSPESHIKEKVWNYFIEYVIRTISEENPGVIFCLWGAKAKAYANGSNPPINRRKSIVLEAGHPSNLNSGASTKFAGNNHFAYICRIIEQQNQQIYAKNLELHAQNKPLLPYKSQINWSLV